MKIVCDSCGTKYSIADEKVKGKVFKIRCKKCSHIIVVKGTGEAAAGEAPKAASFDQKETRVFDYSGFDGAKGDAGGAAPPTEGAPPPSDADAGAGEAVWHLVVDREQIGPMTVAEVQERFQRNEIDADTYGWREGFADWQKLSAIPDFDGFVGGAANGHAAAAPEATGKSDAGDLFASAGAAADKEDEAGDLFGGGAAPSLFGGAAASAPAAEAPRAGGKKRGGDDDLFASAGASGGGDLFGDAGGASASARSEPAPASQGLKGARNENSVLFSLNNLAALASGAPKASSSPSSSSSPQPSGFIGSSTSSTEGSGLIDIRAMAATTMGMGMPKMTSASSAPVDDLPVLSPSTFSASPVLVPVSSSSGTPKWLMPAMIGLGVMLVGVAVVLVIMLTRKPKKDTPPVLAANSGGVNPSTPPGLGGPGDPPSASPTASADPGTSPSPVDPGTTTGTISVPSPGGEVKPSASAKPTHEKGDKTPTKGDKTPTPSKSPSPSKEPTPGEKPPKESGGDVEIKCMINPDLAICKKGGSTTKPDKPDKPTTGGGDLPTRLAKPDIQAGISPIKGSATACFGKYNVPGTVNVKVTIGGNGKVQSASASGSFSGTPTGTCVENAVKKASFKKFSDDSMSFTYPFVLR